MSNIGDLSVYVFNVSAALESLNFVESIGLEKNFLLQTTGSVQRGNTASVMGSLRSEQMEYFCLLIL